MKYNKRIVFYALTLAATVCAGMSEAYAHGRVFVGGGVIVGEPYYAYPPYYSYPYYNYPPAYYPPPPVYQAYEPPPPAPNDRYYTGPSNDYCREYTHVIVVDGQRRQAYGHACRQPDGSWHIID